MKLRIGLDVGSTTVKGIVIDDSEAIVWKRFKRHNTKQALTVLEFLEEIGTHFPISKNEIILSMTGSGSGTIAPLVNAEYVQEVNAVSYAVERLHPTAGTVIELGGQDAKIILYRSIDGKKSKIFSMNDKCAGGTGSVIDRIAAKLNISPDQMSVLGYEGIRIHPVAGKCGVFAETDINTLQKSGIPAEELMASLFEAIVTQNLSVLTRGNPILPEVILLGGPNAFLIGLQEAWRSNIVRLWNEQVSPPNLADPASLICVPENAQYYAAIGSVAYSKHSGLENRSRYDGPSALHKHMKASAKTSAERRVGGLSRDESDLQLFLSKYSPESFTPQKFSKGKIVECFIGIDGGSTSTKGVIIDRNGEMLFRSYILSKGNPIEDTKQIFRNFRFEAEREGVTLHVLGAGTTGYSREILKNVIRADAAVVETVAHTQSALHYYGDVDVICDVGGQDIKIIIIKNGKVKDFRLNTQCSAGNGYYLQSTAQMFGIPVEQYAERAFSAKSAPRFGYGCAVFLQSDIVDFQRQGWGAEEILAGLAKVLPENIWQYVAKISGLSSLGTSFILQGGTQNNLAAVKAQVDYINSHFRNPGIKPEIFVHRYAGECGAIGAALETIRMAQNGHLTRFIGIDAIESISYNTFNDNSTRCGFCSTKCQRTFIDVTSEGEASSESDQTNIKLMIKSETRRLITGNHCERGSVEEASDMKRIWKKINDTRNHTPNHSKSGCDEAWKTSQSSHPDAPKKKILPGALSNFKRTVNRDRIRIGIPRVLSMYSLNPFFVGYFESLGIHRDHIIYSDFTSDQMYRDGIKKGFAIDPCFPAKAVISHIHSLLNKHVDVPLDAIFFPMIGSLPTMLYMSLGTQSCPTITSMPDAVRAAFVRERDPFRENGIRYLQPFLNMDERDLLSRQLYNCLQDFLRLGKIENEKAIDSGFLNIEKYYSKLRTDGLESLRRIERERRIGIVLLSRPYHNDPGINHGIPEEFQKLGYPILTQDSLPIERDILARLFGDEVESGIIKDPLDISDVWKAGYSENTNRKIWAAKFTARHPNLVALELSSFKCGLDAPIYNVIEKIIEMSGTPFFSFRDIDENSPSGSVRIRIETIDYFLKEYQKERFR